MAHREDDRRDRGYCPKCARPLTGLTTEAKGFCEEHGWVFAEWHVPGETHPDDPYADEEDS